MKAVLYFGNNPFVLVDVTKNEHGDITSGWVVNGEWTMEIDERKVYVRKGNNIVDTYVREPFWYIEVPEEMKCNKETFMSVIDWSNERLAEFRKSEQRLVSKERFNGEQHKP